MNERDDFLWDRRGDADDDVRALEQLLAPLAHDGRPLPLDALPEQAQRPRSPRAWPWLLAAAAIALAALGSLWWSGGMRSGDGELRLGSPSRDFVAGATPLRIELGGFAMLTLEPKSRLRFVHWRDEQVLFKLDQGAVVAEVAPPTKVRSGSFDVDTAFGRVVDQQGSRVALAAGDDDSLTVRVSDGAVTVVSAARTVFVPAGAGTTVTKQGATIPVFADSSEALAKAVGYFDTLDLKTKKAGQEVGIVLKNCSDPRDSLVLWHLLQERDLPQRETVEEILISLVGSPEPMTKGGPNSWPPAVWLRYLQKDVWRPLK